MLETKIIPSKLARVLYLVSKSYFGKLLSYDNIYWKLADSARSPFRPPPPAHKPCQPLIKPLNIAFRLNNKIWPILGLGTDGAAAPCPCTGLERERERERERAEREKGGRSRGGEIGWSEKCKKRERRGGEMEERGKGGRRCYFQTVPLRTEFKSEVYV